ncbi:MAG: radical SAM protein [Sphaerochaeta sp.]
MKDIELELSNICNASCPLCFRNNIKYTQSRPYHRPLSSIINQLDNLKDLQSVKLVGTISEPTLYNHFFDLIEYLNSRDLEIEICTNGDTNNTSWWTNLGSLLKKQDKVYFTVCGSTQELHEKYRTGTSLSNIITNVKAYQKGSCNKNDYAQLIRFKYNDQDFDELSKASNSILDIFSNLYWTHTFLALPMNQYKVMTDQLYTDLRPVDKKYPLYKKIQTRADAKINNLKPYCIAHLNHDTIQSDLNGKLYPCYLFSEYYYGKDIVWSYEDISLGKFPVCKYCDHNILKYLDVYDLNYII